MTAVVSDAPSAAEDDAFMAAALAEAREAEAAGDVPVGAALVHEGAVIATGRNRREQQNNPVAHAEMEALVSAAHALGRWRLHGCTLYVTLEPCFMCAGALVNARIDRLVFATEDPKAGAVCSLAEVCTDGRLNHAIEVHRGPCRDEASAMLKAFFAARRSTKRGAS